MKIIAIAVTSADGRFTKNSEKNIYHWSSPEDFAHFSDIKSQYNLIVMGSGTFDAVHPEPEKERLRIIMTNNPQKYKDFAIPEQMEFTAEAPNTLVSRLEKKGYTQLLFVGGGKLLVSFLQTGLIDQLYVTIEPQLFGNGDMLQAEKSLDIQLQLLSVQKLNKRGTLLLQYEVIK